MWRSPSYNGYNIANACLSLKDDFLLVWKSPSYNGYNIPNACLQYLSTTIIHAVLFTLFFFCARITLTRVEVEEACAGVADRVSAACREALRSAEMTAEDVQDVELLGGGSYIPLLRRSVEGTFRLAGNSWLACLLAPPVGRCESKDDSIIRATGGWRAVECLWVFVRGVDELCRTFFLFLGMFGRFGIYLALGCCMERSSFFFPFFSPFVLGCLHFDSFWPSSLWLQIAGRLVLSKSLLAFCAHRSRVSSDSFVTPSAALSPRCSPSPQSLPPTCMLPFFLLLFVCVCVFLSHLRSLSVCVYVSCMVVCCVSYMLTLFSCVCRVSCMLACCVSCVCPCASCLCGCCARLMALCRDRVRRTMSSSESVARGCALAAAQRSSIFKLRYCLLRAAVSPLVRSAVIETLFLYRWW